MREIAFCHWVWQGSPVKEHLLLLTGEAFTRFGFLEADEEVGRAPDTDAQCSWEGLCEWQLRIPGGSQRDCPRSQPQAAELRVPRTLWARIPLQVHAES